MDVNRNTIIEITSSRQQAVAFLKLFAEELDKQQFGSTVADVYTTYLAKHDNDEYIALVKAQRFFEAVSDQNITTGLCLMAELYDKAGELRAHDVADSIELSIDAEGNKELLDYLLTQVDQPDKVIMRKTYEGWITQLQEKLLNDSL